MKVLCIAKFFGGGKGGIEAVTDTLVNGAVVAGYDVSVVCFRSSGHAAKTDASSVQGVAGVSSHRPLVTLLSQPISLSYIWAIVSHRSRVDLVHLHLPNMLGAFAILLSWRPVPLVVHWHSDVIGKGFFGSVLTGLENMILAKASVIISTSESYRKSSDMLKRFDEKVEVIPIGIAESKGPIAAPNNRAIERAIRDKKLILSVGRLVPYKGFMTLVNAMKYIDSDAVVIIVGMGPQYAELDRFIRDSDMETRVILAGALKNEELYYLYENAYLFCMSSQDRAEAFGVVLIEAMMHGIPIVAPDIEGSGVPWVNQDRVTGINYSVGEERSLASACNELLRGQGLRNAYAVNARQRYLSHFTLEQSVNSMLKVYDSLLEKSE